MALHRNSFAVVRLANLIDSFFAIPTLWIELHLISPYSLFSELLRVHHEKETRAKIDRARKVKQEEVYIATTIF